ncbi:PAS domain S-box-containing protein/diguanylate cyclase (GGDEF)-like protein [Edaphobacter modestus]|uniref:PAS domain S-box-containing protein/diguanylate cyclase (GGDEF)-like protein n=1 Tax=Edaphobacter modestus TaxID=388466 RepID=A0A4Q7YY15_9BACT|nr:PAS domain S-box-containing protein/diguanylate cyclase (GGDEF)-like protein [Edaphobacter modestus]
MLDPPTRLRAWKVSVSAVPVCAVIGGLSRTHHGVVYSEIVAAGIAVAGVALAIWSLLREQEYKVLRAQLEEAQSTFLAAAEVSLDAFCLLNAMRDAEGRIVDFRIHYLNHNAERLIGKPRAELVSQSLCDKVPTAKSSGRFGRYCEVVETGISMSQEYAVLEENPLQATWVRYQAVKLGDGLAVTCSDISSIKAAQARSEHLVEFNESVFQNAPFSIVATDVQGTITAMNFAAEKLTGYTRDELVGKASLTMLHDERELAAAARDSAATDDSIERVGFEILSAGAMQGEMEEKEWTLVKRDGSRIPINLAMRAVASDSGDISGFVGIAFDITERRQMLQYVTHLATHDQLTGLVGRALLRDKTVEAVERARRYGTKVAVFVVDLDQFKRINDSLGHTSGDQLLIETAARLRRSVRSTDVVARVGGDEFVVVMPDITSVADVEHCALNLLARMSPEIHIDEQLVNVTTSIGVCIYPDFASDAKHLLKRADSAMYVAKESGRNQYQIFSEDMLKETADRLSMEHGLRHALANSELRLHYQPQISLTTGLITGVEALLRWNHPKLGNVPPIQFIGIAEETGLIVPIGEWVFMTACREGKALQDELGTDLTISVNLSPRQFQQRNLVQVIEHALAVSGLLARNLEIEITENILMVNSTGNLEKLQRIRELGVRISIDDFGTGFCSFSYLLQYQVDRLKIDRSFIKQAGTDPNAAAVVRTIIAMSHGLAIRVVAEGVETEEQLRFLMRRRCDEAQGNYLGLPVAAENFSAAVQGYSGIGALQNV